MNEGDQVICDSTEILALRSVTSYADLKSAYLVDSGVVVKEKSTFLKHYFINLTLLEVPIKNLSKKESTVI